jgi:hypothetical protein
MTIYITITSSLREAAKMNAVFNDGEIENVFEAIVTQPFPLYTNVWVLETETEFDSDFNEISFLIEQLRSSLHNSGLNEFTIDWES